MCSTFEIYPFDGHATSIHSTYIKGHLAPCATHATKGVHTSVIDSLLCKPHTLQVRSSGSHVISFSVNVCMYMCKNITFTLCVKSIDTQRSAQITALNWIAISALSQRCCAGL